MKKLFESYLSEDSSSSSEDDEELLVNKKISHELIRSILSQMENDKCGEEFTIVNLDINKVFVAWKNDDCFIGPKFEDLKQYDRRKFIQSYKDLINMEVTEPPCIYINNKKPNEKRITFINGRNRFLNIRNSYQGSMPFKVLKDEMEEMKETFS